MMITYTQEELSSIVHAFAFPGTITDWTPHGNGHINDTFLVRSTENGVLRKSILQRMNRTVFHNPTELMQNIAQVTSFLRKKITAAGGDPFRETLNLIPSVIAYQRCIEQGCQETVFHRGERVTECAHSNILIIKDGILCTPPRDNLILPGITLKHLLMLAEKNGIPTSEAPFTMQELADADEIIVSSSGGLCIQAVELDGKPIGGKDPKTLKTLQDAYAEFYAEDTKVR